MLNLKIFRDWRYPGTFNNICTHVRCSAHVFWWNRWNHLSSLGVRASSVLVLEPDSSWSICCLFLFFFLFEESLILTPDWVQTPQYTMPVRPSTWLLRYVFSVRACIFHLAVTCLTPSRAVWGRPQSVLIFWWVPALVQPSLVPLGCLSVLFFLLHSFLFSPLSRFFLMWTQIFLLSSCLMVLRTSIFPLSVRFQGTLKLPIHRQELSCLVRGFCLLRRCL